MKKIVISIMCLTIMLGLFGCKKNTTIKEVDKSFKFSLESNPSTGYGWKYDVDNNDVISIKEEYDGSNCPNDVDGCGGNEVFTINGVKEGTASMHLKYCFLGTNECDKEVTYVFNVNGDLTISATHTKR